MALDTETTGLGPDAEAVQIGVVAPDGAVLLDTLLRPSVPIPDAAMSIHGITNAMVDSAPTFAEIAERLVALLEDKTVVIYNAQYDTRILRQTARACGATPLEFAAVCAMERYAAFVGEWNSYYGNYRWQRLPTGDHGAHSAVGDCLATLDVIRRMAGAGVRVEAEVVPSA